MAEKYLGKITKGIAGFYYVYVDEIGLVECKAKGVFRKDNIKPCVGDDVEIDLLSLEEKKGNITHITPARNKLVRPAVCNIDQAVVIFAITKPEPNLNLLDRFLIQMEQQGVETIVCFNKADLDLEGQGAQLFDLYTKAGYQVLLVSAKEDQDLEKIFRVLEGKTSTVAGPSGVGKSSIVNRLQSKTVMETGELSEKIERGKHTTRHSQLIPIGKDTFIFDTPGFSSLSLFDIEKEELGDYYPEFSEHLNACKFHPCSHIHEPVCGVKRAVESFDISSSRYENYKLLYAELEQKKKY